MMKNKRNLKKQRKQQTVTHGSQVLDWMDCSISHRKRRWQPNLFQTLWLLSSHFCDKDRERIHTPSHWWSKSQKHKVFFVCANLWRMFFTEFAHSAAADDSKVWELAAVTSTTQLCGDSSSSRGREPSSNSWLLPPPKLTAAFRRFSCKWQHRGFNLN